MQQKTSSTDILGFKFNDSETLQIIKKPWGEEHWIELNNAYCYKRIYLNAGYKTSLQYHEKKLETNYLISGQAVFTYGDDINNLKSVVMVANDSVTIQPGMIHRFAAISDIILQEVSTPEVDDVIRIEDDTNRPSGRIENEHK